MTVEQPTEKEVPRKTQKRISKNLQKRQQRQRVRHDVEKAFQRQQRAELEGNRKVSLVCALS